MNALGDDEYLLKRCTNNEYVLFYSLIVVRNSSSGYDYGEDGKEVQLSFRNQHRPKRAYYIMACHPHAPVLLLHLLDVDSIGSRSDKD